MQPKFWRRLRPALAAAPFVALSVGIVPTPSVAEPPSTGVETEPQCDIRDFRRINIIDAGASDKEPGQVSQRTAVGITNILPLDQPVPAGTVLVSGVTNDRSHRKDTLDFTSTLTETGERVTIRFVDEAGNTVGETSPTPDLPDTATVAPFAQPSIELSAPAHGVQIVHAGDGTSINDLRVRCLNIDPVTADSPPTDLVRFLTCSDENFYFDPAPTLQCGFMAVPEERSNPDSRLINVAFGIVPGELSTAEPLVYLEGGPGGAPLTFSGLLQELAFEEIAGGRDMIYVDQRGTGFSQPTLACTQLEDLLMVNPPLEDLADADEQTPTEQELLEALRQQTQACKDRLVGQGIDLSAYTTVENAADIDDLRLGLGLDSWNLFGGSYGTDLALTIMRDHPEGVTSAILDSVFQPEVIVGNDDLTGYQNNLDEIVTRCLTDDDCGVSFPDLADDINAAATNVANEPIPIDVEGAEFFFDETGLDINVLSLMMIFEEANPSLPAWINGLASDDPNVRYETTQNFAQSIIALTLDALPTDVRSQRSYQQRGLPSVATFFSDGFYLSVICSEEFPYQDNSAIARSSDTVWSPELLDAAAFDLFSACDVWDVAPEDPIVTEAVTSDIPSLVYGSETDFQTWPEWSRRAAETLPNSTLVEFSQLPHVVSIGNPCPSSISASFVKDPTAELDTSCVDQQEVIDYAGALPPAPSDEEIEELAEEAGVADIL